MGLSCHGGWVQFHGHGNRDNGLVELLLSCSAVQFEPITLCQFSFLALTVSLKKEDVGAMNKWRLKVKDIPL